MKCIKRLLIFIAFLIVIFIIWIHLPYEESGFKASNEMYFIQGFLNIERQNAGILKEAADFKFKEEYVIESKYSRYFLKNCAKYILPLHVDIVAQPLSDDQQEFDFLVVIKSSVLRRIIEIPLGIYRLLPDFKNAYKSYPKDNWRIFEARDNDEDLKLIALYANTIVLTSNKEMFKESFKATYDKNKISAACKPIPSSGKIRDEQFEADKKDLKRRILLDIVVNNEYGLFEHFVNELKSEASYNIFVSAETLKKIDIYVLNSEIPFSHQGYMNFAYAEDSDLTQSKKDVRFFLQVLRRLMDANTYILRYRTNETTDQINVDYRLEKTKE
jgi:hypothetical protein